MTARHLCLGLSCAILLMAQHPTRIAVHALENIGQPIPPTLFGSFLEPIGNSTYNGLWAEVLQNPSFESGLWSATAIRGMIAANPELRALRN